MTKYMYNEAGKNYIREQILSAIKDGRIKMRPRWHFVLQASLLATGGMIVSLAVLYLASFIVFTLRETGAWFVPAFGWRGWYVFLLSLPWLLVLLSILFVVILEILVRHYAFSYRRPLLYSVLGVLFVVVIGSIIIDQARVHDRLFRTARSGRLPFAGPLYREFGTAQLRMVHRGQVARITDRGFAIQNIGGEILFIIVTPETRFPRGMDFGEGDTVVVFGDRDDRAVRAFGVRKIEEELYENMPHLERRRPFRLPVFSQ